MISVHDVIAFIEYELALRAVHPAESPKPAAGASAPLRGAAHAGPADIRRRQSDSTGPSSHGRRE